MRIIHRFQAIRGGIPRQNLLFFSRDGVTDIIGLSITDAPNIDLRLWDIFFIVVDGEVISKRDDADIVALALVSPLRNVLTMFVSTAGEVALYNKNTDTATLTKACLWARETYAPVVSFLIGGQSNASGRGLIADGEAPSDNVLMFGNDYVWKIASEPVDDWTNQVDAVSNDSAQLLTGMHSFTLRAGKDIAASSSKKVMLIPCPKGGSGVQGWYPGTNVLDRTTLYGSANYRRSIAAPAGLTALWWFGHETSAAGGSDLIYFQDFWLYLLTKLREQFGNIPIVYAQLAKHQTAAINTGQNNVADKQRRLDASCTPNPLVIGPAVFETDFTSVAYVSGVPDGWSRVNSNATNYTEQAANGVRLVSDGTTLLTLRKSGMTVGTQYMVVLTMGAAVAGKARLYHTAEIGNFDKLITFKLTYTAGASYIDINRYSGVTDVTIKSMAVYPYTSGSIWQPNSNDFMVVAFDLPLIDIIHLDQGAQREVGRRFALATRQHVLGESVNGTGPRLVSISQPAADAVKIKYNKTISEPQASSYNGQHIVYDNGVAATISSVARDPADDTAVLIALSAPIAGTMTVSYGDVAASGAGVWLHDVVQDSDLLPAPQFYRLGIFG